MAAKEEPVKYKRMVVLVHPLVYARVEISARAQHHKVGPWVKLAMDEKLSRDAQKSMTSK